ncbi:MAG: hypothetical protein KF861_10960, partial [Planctomycetaceae bacterium]|nr:hypothetical protein [Planctomycetaceae bacterium]
MMEPVRYPVKLSTLLRVGYVGVGIMCLSLAADSAEADLKTQVLAWGFFGVGGLLVLKLMLRNTGWLTLREDGLLIDTHWTTGLIRWEHLQKPQAVRLMGVSHLGLSTLDPQAYFESRKQLSELANETDRAYTQGFFRGMVAMLSFLPPAKIAVDVGLTLFGWSPLPKSGTEADMLEWQGKNYGVQIAIPRLWIADFDKVLSELQSRARGTATLSTSSKADASFRPRLHTPDSVPSQTAEPAQLKTCPMCAESVQAQA